MPAEPPPAERLTLDDIDAHGLELQAACPQCKAPRRIVTTETMPGWRKQPPLLDVFWAGKMPCNLHGQPATVLRILHGYKIAGSQAVYGEWRRD